jgi:surface polysaccharide O-acyltransferase-like enzyme
MFFLISGYLFSKTHKSTSELYKQKTLRILIPYLAMMSVIIIVKLMIPARFYENQAASEGVISAILNTLLYGGDRWFLYTMFLMFLLVIPVRNYLKNKWIDIALIVVLTIVYFIGFMPQIFLLNKLFYYLVFFVAGYALKDSFYDIKAWTLKYWWAVYGIGILANGVFILPLEKIPFVFRFILPLTGTSVVMTLAFQLEKIILKSKIVQYVEYCGKYTLQFYLFPGAAIARIFVINVLRMSNPFIIVVSMFFLQVIIQTILVEITRRIKWLKIPCGY